MGSKRQVILPSLAVLAVAAAVLLSHGGHAGADAAAARPFARTSGTRFTVGGRPFYSNGFNAYWLMYMASDATADRSKAADVLRQAARLRATLVRTWAFSDGGYRPLQKSPGVYNESMFMGLDFVIAEANKRGLYLILSLVNNWDGFGGKKQYVQWARDQGHYLGSDDQFFTSEVTKQFYKNHVKAVLTRVNKITGVAYKDEPAIFAWELMNEPRCQSDLSGKTLQAWITEMAGYVKSVDPNHMVEIGLEGFYGESMHKNLNPGYTVGTDFIANNLVPAVDFATIHSYPDQWVAGASSDEQVAFMRRWLASHIQDAAAVLRKPLLVTEFGWSARSNGYAVAARDAYFRMVFDAVYASARAGGPCAGGLFWQVMAPGMESWTDGYEVVLERSPSTASVVAHQCARIAGLSPAGPAWQNCQLL
ncbi:putative mannan endo-1,4-beta-mannosidase 9 [Oryza brachyantha]|uniref:putative mannan endo-1,4-beta-mannosidase 9 n=1 Tax=Oryza brachyantha TaxID=4533 RepID=UPI001ADCA8F7|nr:putative mannan endo-1,4-beta-mannosidase 9 [Oryza brachyantha]